jgi:hypothetical protein
MDGTKKERMKDSFQIRHPRGTTPPLLQAGPSSGPGWRPLSGSVIQHFFFQSAVLERDDGAVLRTPATIMSTLVSLLVGMVEHQYPHMSSCLPSTPYLCVPR